MAGGPSAWNRLGVHKSPGLRAGGIPLYNLRFDGITYRTEEQIREYGAIYNL